MSHGSESIQIKEPAVEELRKGRSCLTRSCLSGCFMLLLLIIVGLILTIIISQPREKTLKNVPDSVPADVPIYDVENVHLITIIEGADRSKLRETVAAIPKAVLIPLYLWTEDILPMQFQDAFGPPGQEESTWQQYIRLVRQPIAQDHDLVTLTWIELPATPSFVYEYYETELAKAGYTVFRVLDARDNVKELRFSDDTEQLIGTVQIDDDTPADRQSDKATMSLSVTTDTR